MVSSLISRLRKAALVASAASLLGAPLAFAQEEPKADEPPKAEASATPDEAAKPDEAKPDEAAAKPDDAKPDEAAAKPDDAKPDEAAKADDAKPDDAAKSDDAAKASAAEPPARGPAAAPPPADDPDAYTIQRGDTLWDLSNKFLASPWYWPKIWTANPYIENPHWIYPGQRLRIKPGKGVAQAQPEPQEQEEAKVDETESPPSIAPKLKEETPDFAITRPRRSDSDAVSASGKLAYVAPASIRIKPAGIIATEDLAIAGVLQGSFEEKALLSLADQAYVKFKGDAPAKVGARYTIFKKDGTIRHPVTHQPVGEKIRVIGEAKIISVKGEIATIVVLSANSEIERGDLIGNSTSIESKKVDIKPNTKSVDAIILAAENNDLSEVGQFHQVFIDKGTADGVEEGNTFIVERSGDGLGSFGGPAKGTPDDSTAHRDNPAETVGMLVIVDAKERVSTALVLKSVREIQPGELAHMRPAGSGGD